MQDEPILCKLHMSRNDLMLNSPAMCLLGTQSGHDNVILTLNDCYKELQTQ